MMQAICACFWKWADNFSWDVTKNFVAYTTILTPKKFYFLTVGTSEGQKMRTHYKVLNGDFPILNTRMTTLVLRK